MKKSSILLFVPMLLLAGAPRCLAEPSISGDYLEARTSDIYTGPCFANSEVNLTGKEAIVAWRVRQGVWDGVRLDGLAVVAVVRAAATLGDPFADPYPAKSLLFVDRKATARERQALVGFAHAMGGPLLGQVLAVADEPIEVAIEDGHGGASLRAGDAVELKTRGLHHGDHLCGNEEVYYPPLSASADAVPAVTLVHLFRGAGLGKTWSSPGKRSAFVGSFAR
ncbi:MAG TPA: DUF1326 domain-containing protein [Thermoanaerobaculia bacterium]|nr:DUF1326 domain-containing protein [Thermoanaerobaculia bacterium]